MAARTRLLGGFSIDAVLYADGSYDVDRLGGNAFWAAMGARLAGGHPAVHAVVGDDYPDAALAELAGLGMQVGGILRRPGLASTRVSFTYSADGHREQPADERELTGLPESARRRFIDNTDSAELLLAMLPTAAEVAGESDDGDGIPDAWYLGLLPASRLRELVPVLAGRGPLLLDCPERGELLRDGFGALREVLPAVEVFLPSTSDARVFLPRADAGELIRTFHGWGAEAVLLKCGEHGAIVSVGGRRWHVPVVLDPAAFDPTGAGDVFGGACTAEFARSGDLLAAAVAGAAAASFAPAARSPLELAGVSTTDYESRRIRIAAGVEEIGRTTALRLPTTLEPERRRKQGTP